MDFATPQLRREDLEPAFVRCLHRGGGANADVRLVRVDGRDFVVKDYAARGGLLRRGLARWLVSRELRAYRQLEGLDALPRLLGRVDELAFALEYRSGRPLSRSLAGELPGDFLAALERAVAQMHSRGVVHLDLRHRSNVLAGDDGRPVLIDFASAVCLSPRRFMGRLLLTLLAPIDRLALRKWRARLSSTSQE